MPAVKLTAFIGEKPRIIPRLLPDTAAQAAVNVRLDDGGLTPIRLSVQEASLPTPDQRTIYKHHTEWLSWSDVVHAAPGPVADDRLYYTGDGVPKVRIAGEVYPLAVPRPTDKPTAAVAGAGSGDVQTRVYCHTWVTEFGEESEPSPVTDRVDWQPGQTVTLSGFSTVPSGRGITLQRIYRSQTGQSGTYLYFVAERAAGTTDFVDTVPVDQFQEPLPSASWNAPPDDLSGLISLPNGMMAAFVGRRLYFCEPYRPHAWPEKYVLTTDYDIVGLGATGTTMIVLTTGNPYLVSGASPEAMQMVKLEANLPCINPRGIVDLGFAICYPTVEGLVTAKADGSIGIVSTDLFNRDEWLAFSPSTIIGGQIAGRYVAFYDTIDESANVVAGALIIDVGASPFLIRSSARATAVFYNIEDSGLYYQPHGLADIYRLDAPSGARATVYWRSKPFYLPAPDNFGACRVDASAALTAQEVANYDDLVAEIEAENAALLAAGPLAGEINGAPLNRYAFGGSRLKPMPAPISGNLTIGIYADDKRVADVGRIGQPVRLPSGFKARKWEVDVSGDVKVEQIVVAKTMDELKQVV